MSVSELGCTLAALILHDDGIPITVCWFPYIHLTVFLNDLFIGCCLQAEKIAALVKAANLTVESYWPSLFAKLCDKRNIEDLILNVGSGGGAASVAVAAPGAATGGAAPAAAAPAAEEKKVNAQFFFFKKKLYIKHSFSYSYFVLLDGLFLIIFFQEEPKEESDDDMGFSLFD